MPLGEVQWLKGFDFGDSAQSPAQQALKPRQDDNSHAGGPHANQPSSGRRSAENWEETQQRFKPQEVSWGLTQSWRNLTDETWK